MAHPRRQRRDGDIGVFINRSHSFTVGPTRHEPDGPEQKPDPPQYMLRSYTGQVLEGVLLVPGRIQGDIVWGTALVQLDGESAFFTVQRSGNAVRFHVDDFEAVNGAQATVSYLTAN